MIAFCLSMVGFGIGFLVGFVFFRSERAYREGWQHGELYGRAEGYRLAWLKRNKALLNAEREDWNDD
jgi:hypothetical protein